MPNPSKTITAFSRSTHRLCNLYVELVDGKPLVGGLYHYKVDWDKTEDPLPIDGPAYVLACDECAVEYAVKRDDWAGLFYEDGEKTESDCGGWTNEATRQAWTVLGNDQRCYDLMQPYAGPGGEDARRLEAQARISEVNGVMDWYRDEDVNWAEIWEAHDEAGRDKYKQLPPFTAPPAPAGTSLYYLTEDESALVDLFRDGTKDLQQRLLRAAREA